MSWRGTRWTVAATASLALGWTLCAAPSAPAATFNVTNANDSGPGSLRQAISDANAAAGADTIIVPAGHYLLSGAAGEDANASGDLDITQDLTIEGAGTNTTIIDGSNNDRAFDIFNAGTSVSINGIAITNGNNQFGSAIRSVGSSLSVTGVDISANVAGGGGTSGFGAIRFTPSLAATLAVEQSNLANNTSGGGAGGTGFGTIFFSSAAGGTATVTDTSFTANTLGGGGGSGFGGGIYFSPSDGKLTIANSSFANNTLGGGGGSGFGGGAFFSTAGSGTVEISASTFTGNRLGGGGPGFGGGIHFTPGNGSMTITASTMSNNILGGGGGSGSAAALSSVPPAQRR